MADPKSQLLTQLANIEKRTGKTLKELQDVIARSGLEKHGQIVAMLKADLGMGHGDANTLVHITKDPSMLSATPTSGSDVQDAVSAIYSGKKEALRPIHDAVMKRIATIGEFEIAPKKTYVSLRRKKQFAMIGPGTNVRVDVGLNMKGAPGTSRLKEEKPGGMCSHTVQITDPAQVDDELLSWLRQAFEQAG